MVLLKTLTGTLEANVNEITFTDSLITENSIIEVYYNNNDVYTVETWYRGNTIGIVTNDHEYAVGVKVLINNVVSFEPYDDSELVSRISNAEDNITALDGRLDIAEDDITSLDGRLDIAEDNITTLGTSKQDVLIPGDNITIENNVISSTASGNNDYSTTEKLVGKWIDNKNLYEKTFYIDNLSIYTRTVLTTLTNIDTLIFKFAIFRESGASYMLPDMSARITFNSSGEIALSPNTGSSWIGAIIFTILYTKINE